jgi:hypothetical protein
MAVLVWGSVLFLAALLTHLLVWRLRKPRSPMKALMLILLGVITAGLAALYCGDGIIRSYNLDTPGSMAAYLHTLLFSVSMSLAYITSYTLLEWGGSPTLAIVMAIARAGKAGATKAELLGLADKLPFIESRIQCLIQDKTIVEKDGHYMVSPGRHLFFGLVLFYRRLWGADTAHG